MNGINFQEVLKSRKNILSFKEQKVTWRDVLLFAIRKPSKINDDYFDYIADQTACAHPDILLEWKDKLKKSGWKNKELSVFVDFATNIKNIIFLKEKKDRKFFIKKRLYKILSMD